MDWVELIPTYEDSGANNIDPWSSGNFYVENYYNMEVDPALGQFPEGAHMTHLKFIAAGPTYTHVDGAYELSSPMTSITVVLRNREDDRTRTYFTDPGASDTYEVDLAPYYALQDVPEEWFVSRVAGDTRYSDGPTGTAEYTIEAVVELPPEVDENFWSRYIDTREVMRSISE